MIFKLSFIYLVIPFFIISCAPVTYTDNLTPLVAGPKKSLLVVWRPSMALGSLANQTTQLGTKKGDKISWKPLCNLASGTYCVVSLTPGQFAVKWVGFEKSKVLSTNPGQIYFVKIELLNAVSGHINQTSKEEFDNEFSAVDDSEVESLIGN